MSAIIYLCLGGMFGTLMRYFVSGWVYKILGTDFPYGTMVVNIGGCLLIGFMGTLAEERFVLSPNLRLFLLVGFLGAFTTFSTFSYESWKLLQSNDFTYSLLNISLSVLVGMLAVWLGAVLARTC
jgi:CrcB protein